jgi:hypothetical protein
MPHSMREVVLFSGPGLPWPPNSALKYREEEKESRCAENRRRFSGFIRPARYRVRVDMRSLAACQMDVQRIVGEIQQGQSATFEHRPVNFGRFFQSHHLANARIQIRQL